MKAQDIMQREVITVKGDTSVEEIALILTKNRISGLPVVDDNGKLTGIVTEGDLLRKELSPRLPDFINILGAIIYYNGVKRYNEDFKKLAAKKASEMMTTNVIAVAKEAEIQEVAKLMVKHNIKRIPVVEDGKVIGIISRSDIIRTLAVSGQQEE